MNQTQQIQSYVKAKDGSVTIDEVVEAFPDIKRHVVRGRLNDGVRKGILKKHTYHGIPRFSKKEENNVA